MNKQAFKAGDLIYCPIYTTKIAKLKDSGCDIYPFEFYYFDEEGYERFGACTADGKLGVGASVPAICHATEEKCAMLEGAFEVEFEKPKSKPTPKEIITHLLTKQKYVLCWVGDYGESSAREDKVIDVVRRVGDKGYDSIRNWADYWIYAIPIDLQGNEITEIE